MTLAASASIPSTVQASLLEICQQMGSRLDLPEVLDTILHLSLHEMRAQQGSILLFNEHQDRLEMLASRGLPEEIARKGYIPRKGSIAEYVIEHNEPLILNDRPRGTGFESVDDRRRIVSAMCVPLRARGTVLGTINLNRTDDSVGPFANEDIDTMLILSSQAAVCIENSRLHESLIKAERLAAIGQTVAGVSHCIKNVLTGIRGGVSLVDMASAGEDWNLLRQGMDILRRNIDRVSTIVLDMLEYSKERKPAKARHEVSAMFQEVTASVASKAEAKNVALEISIAPDCATLMADGQQLFRSMLNLVHNAIDASSEGGFVRLSAERTSALSAMRRLRQPVEADSAVVLRVADSGSGISAENINQIFEPFFSTKGSKGTGLGLAVTRKIMEEHGGLIEVESRPDEPAIFALYLPD